MWRSTRHWVACSLNRGVGEKFFFLSLAYFLFHLIVSCCRLSINMYSIHLMYAIILSIMHNICMMNLLNNQTSGLGSSTLLKYKYFETFTSTSTASYLQEVLKYNTST